MIKSLKPGLLLGVALFLSHFSWATSPSVPEAKESLETLIEKAEEMTLAGKRVEALALLSTGEKDLKPGELEKLKEKRIQLAEVFLTESGQKAFELGQSLDLKKPNLIETQYLNALETEDSNSLVLLALASLKLREKNLAEAKNRLDQLEQIHGMNRQGQYLKAALLTEQNKASAVDKILKQWKEPYLVHEELLKVRWFLMKSKEEEARSEINKLIEKYPEAPEPFYWKWVLSKKEEAPDRESAQKYLSLCKSLALSSQRQLGKDPFLCIHITEVEEALENGEVKNS